MNIFDINLDKIKKIIIDQNKKGSLKLPDNLDSINVDIPPKQFDYDISTNVAMVLSKLNQKSPIDLANQLIELIKNGKIQGSISGGELLSVFRNAGLRITVPTSISVSKDGKMTSLSDKLSKRE